MLANWLFRWAIPQKGLPKCRISIEILDNLGDRARSFSSSNCQRNGPVRQTGQQRLAGVPGEQIGNGVSAAQRIIFRKYL